MPDPRDSFKTWIKNHFGEDKQEQATKEEQQKIKAAYQAVMKSEEGEIVFNDLLKVCGFIDFTGGGPGDIARLNIAKYILKRTGKWTNSNGTRIIQAICRLPDINKF